MHQEIIKSRDGGYYSMWVNEPKKSVMSYVFAGLLVVGVVGMWVYSVWSMIY